MLSRLSAVCCLALLPFGANADCQDKIAQAQVRADVLPNTPGKAALLEQIQRAANERHEGDEAGCAEALSSATDVLDKVDAFNAKAKKLANAARQ